jgi:hypothetical protein
MTASIAFNARELNLSNGSGAFEAVKQCMIKNNKVAQDLNVSQLKALVKWCKRPDDSKLPERKQDLILCYELTKGRVVTERNQKKDDEER